MNSSRVSIAGSGGALTSIPSMPINHRFSLTHWCTICSCTLRPRGSPARGRTGRPSAPNSLHALTTLIRSVSYVSKRKSYRMMVILQSALERNSPPRQSTRQLGCLQESNASLESDYPSTLPDKFGGEGRLRPNLEAFLPLGVLLTSDGYHLMVALGALEEYLVLYARSAVAPSRFPRAHVQDN